MSNDEIFDRIKSKYEEKEEINTETILSETTSSKIKNRKANIFRKIMSIRNKLIISNNDNKSKEINKSQKRLNFVQIFKNIKNINDKIIIAKRTLILIQKYILIFY